MNVVDGMTTQYKQGWKTSELWIAIAAGLTQTLGASFGSSEDLNNQLSNLTWVAVSYILARSGLKVARVASQAKVASSAAPAEAAAAAAAGGFMLPGVSPEMEADELLDQDFGELDFVEQPLDEHAGNGGLVDERVFESAGRDETIS